MQRRRVLNRPDITLDSYIISARSHAETVRYFGDPNHPYTMDDFTMHHVLFPGFAAAQLLEAVTVT
jgi:hypothetical protein